MARYCARPDCSSPAGATMTYDYRSRTVWLDDMTSDPVAGGYDLCLQHADDLKVPQGWSCSERRGEVVALFGRQAV